MSRVGKSIQLTAAQPPMPLQGIFTALLNRLSAEDLDTPRVLVLDDYHLIHNQIIHDALSFFVEHAPPGLEVILTTRADPPLPLARWRARGLDACKIFPKDAVEAFMGKPLTLDKSQRGVKGVGIVSTCSYKVVDTVGERAQIIVRQMGNPEQARKLYEQSMFDFCQADQSSARRRGRRLVIAIVVIGFFAGMIALIALGYAPLGITELADLWPLVILALGTAGAASNMSTGRRIVRRRR